MPVAVCAPDFARIESDFVYIIKDKCSYIQSFLADIDRVSLSAKIQQW